MAALGEAKMNSMTVPGETKMNSVTASGGTKINSMAASGEVRMNSMIAPGETKVNSMNVPGETKMNSVTASGETKINSMAASGEVKINSITAPGETKVNSMTPSGEMKMNSMTASGEAKINSMTILGEKKMNSMTASERAKRNANRIEKLKKFESTKFLEYEDTIDFRHPFACKFLGSRGSGKTTFLIHYLNTGVSDDYDNIIWITTTAQQKILEYVQDKDKIKFLKPDKAVIETLCTDVDNNEPSKKTLILFDDSMLEECVKNNKKILEFYTGGRHKGISTISLEQHISISHNVEKGNTDYYVLFRLNDYESVDVFRKKFCCEYSLEEFIKIYNYCLEHDRPLIITLNSLPKYRCNFNEEISLSIFGNEPNGIRTTRILRSTDRLHKLEPEEEKRTSFMDKVCCAFFKCFCCFY